MKRLEDNLKKYLAVVGIPVLAAVAVVAGVLIEPPQVLPNWANGSELKYRMGMGATVFAFGYVLLRLYWRALHNRGSWKVGPSETDNHVLQKLTAAREELREMREALEERDAEAEVQVPLPRTGGRRAG
jgi:hypothetical protein